MWSFVCHFYEVFLKYDLNEAAFEEFININEYRKYIISKFLQNNEMTSCCICKQKKSGKPLLKLFASTLNYLDCKHAYHDSCFKK